MAFSRLWNVSYTGMRNKKQKRLKSKRTLVQIFFSEARRGEKRYKMVLSTLLSHLLITIIYRTASAKRQLERN